MYEYKAEYISNYDGDTIRFMVDLGFGIYHRIIIRLAGVDTPELRTAELNKRVVAYEAKDFVREAMLGASEIIIKTNKDKTGKYGRYIAEVLYDGMNLKDELIDNALGEPY